jgi:hypothetical protein
MENYAVFYKEELFGPSVTDSSNLSLQEAKDRADFLRASMPGAFVKIVNWNKLTDFFKKGEDK